MVMEGTRDRHDELLRLYELLPFHHPPLWRGIRSGVLTYEQVIRAELQHCLRTAAGQVLRREALTMAKALSPRIFERLLETYLEECTHDASGPSHLDLIQRLVRQFGVSDAEIMSTPPTPGNAAAMALYREITRRGAGCHMLVPVPLSTFIVDSRQKFLRHIRRAMECRKSKQRRTACTAQWMLNMPIALSRFWMKQLRCIAGTPSG